MTNVVTKIFASMVAVLAGALLALSVAVPNAWAVSYMDIVLTPNAQDDTVNVAIESNGELAGVRALQLNLDIELTEYTASEVKVGFTFDDSVKASVREYNVIPDQDGYQLELYVAGGEDLLASKLNLGKVNFTIAARNAGDSSKPAAGAIVSASSDALSIVDGGYEVRSSSDVGTVSGDSTFIALGDLKYNPNDYISEDDPNHDVIVASGDPVRQGSILTALSQTGDTLMPLVVTLLCVVALAAAAMAFIVIRRRKHL